MLTITKVSRKDAGLYECAAANTLGTAISSCTLAVARKEAGGGPRGTEVLPRGERARARHRARGWGPVGAGYLSSALHIYKRLGLLRGDRLVLHGHLQHL